MPTQRDVNDLRMQVAGAEPGGSMGDPEMIEQIRAILSQIPPEDLMALSQMPPEEIQKMLLGAGVSPEEVGEAVELILGLAEQMSQTQAPSMNAGNTEV